MTAPVLPEPVVRVEVDFGGASTRALLHLDDPTRGLLGTGMLGSASADHPVWTDITPWLASGTINRGSRRIDTPVIIYEPGTCSLILWDRDRRFDPTNLDGPHTAAGGSLVTARRGVRVLAAWAGATYELFRGTADLWDIQHLDPGYSQVTLTATDAFKLLAGVDRTGVAAAGAGETTGQRIHRVLDSAGWPVSDRAVASGQSTVQATDLSGPALTELQAVAATEIGDLYIDGGGRAVFRGRHALLTEPRSASSQAVFGDGPGELPYTSLPICNDDATFFNDVRVTRPGGIEQVAADTASQAVFYVKTYRPSTDPLLETDSDARNYADWLLRGATVPELRFESMTLTPAADPARLYPHALGRDLGDRITAIRRPPGGGAPIVRDVIIRGVEHQFAGGDWRTQWTFQAADPSVVFLTLDHPASGRLDTCALAY